MKKLAEAARNGDSQGMISCSRAIAEVVKKIKAECKELASKCTDPKLKDNIMVRFD